MWFFIYLALFLFGLFVLATIYSLIQEYIIRKKRSEDKKEDFINYFEEKGISRLLALDVYQYLQNWMSFNDFPVRPQDKLAVIYGIADEDLDDLIKEVAEANSLEIPRSFDYWDKPIITVEDLIEFINSFPPRNSQ